MAQQPVEAMLGHSLDDIIKMSEDKQGRHRSRHGGSGPRGGERREVHERGEGRGRPGGRHRGGGGRGGRGRGGGRGDWAQGQGGGMPAYGHGGGMYAGDGMGAGGWQQPYGGAGPAQGWHGGQWNPGMGGALGLDPMQMQRMETSMQNALVRFDRSGLSRKPEERKAAKRLRCEEVVSAEGNKTGEFRVTYSSSGFKEDDVILLAAIGPTGDMRLQTGGDRSPEMLAALGVILQPTGAKISQTGTGPWMLTVGKTMRQFADGMVVPPTAQSGRLRGKAVMQAITNPLVAAASAASLAAAEQEGVSTKVGGPSPLSGEKRRLAAQGRYAPY